MRVTKQNQPPPKNISDVSQQSKPPNPKIFQALKSYQKLKENIYRHFFENQPLNISNKESFEPYSNIHQLLNHSQQMLQDQKKYQSLEKTLLEMYFNDLRDFSHRVREQISMAKGMKAEEQIMWAARWVNTYSRFNHWIFKTFMSIQNNAMRARDTKLYFEGVKMLKEEVIEPIYDQLFNCIFQCLELYKDEMLRGTESVQIMVRCVGLVGLIRFQQVDMAKTIDGRFEYYSKKKDDQLAQNPYSTGYFKKNFLSRLIKALKVKYNAIVSNMMNLSTPEYFDNAKRYIQRQESTADVFYSLKSVKEIVIRNVLETLIVERAEELLKNSKSGLGCMIKEKDIKNMGNVYGLLKKANMTRVFFKEMQGYIQAEGEAILSRITPEDERAMKKQTILNVFKEILQFNSFIDSIREDIDPLDAELQKAQNVGFQGFCNIGNKVCNFLAHYADLVLRKDQGSPEQLVGDVNRISKYLYSYDYFLKMHQKLLGLRILYDSFRNPQAEYALIGMLKNEAGVNATSKLTSMITDHKASEGWNSEFKLKGRFGFGFDVMMLTSGSWQITDPKCGSKLVPEQLLPAVTAFEKKFQEKMPNRGVSWIFNHGRAIVQFITNSNSKHILVLNNYQLLALLHFQSTGFNSIKYGELITVLQVEQEVFFKNSLMNLLKNGVLVRKGGTGRIESRNDQLSVNLDAKFKGPKVGCIVMPKYTEKNTKIAEQVSMERCILIDAALVKVMKQRRRAPYNEVIAEVQKMCKTFKAQIPQIKLRIENCQQRNFLQRDPDDKTVLIYKP